MDLLAKRRKALEQSVRRIERSTQALSRAFKAYLPLSKAARDVEKSSMALCLALCPCPKNTVMLTENQQKIAEANRVIAAVAITLSRSVA